MLFNRKVKKVYIDTDTPAVHSEEMLDIILSPAYYWVKRQSLPVRYLREAKKLLPSLFEDILPKGNYSYTAYKEEDDYLLFAYSDKTILDTLAAKGVKPSQIHKVYFAQSEFSTMERALQIDEQSALSLQGGIVVKLPLQFTGSTTPLNLDTYRISSHDIDLARYAHIADQRSIARFSAFMAILTLLFGMEWAVVSAKTGELEQERARLFERYDLPSTTIQNEAILKRLEQRYTEQSALRGTTAKLLALQLQEGEQMTRYEYDGTHLNVTFAIPSQNRANAVAARLKREGLEFTHTFGDQNLRLEFSL
jgi:hypothetical protein